MDDKYVYPPLSGSRNIRRLLLEPNRDFMAPLRGSFDEISLDDLLTPQEMFAEMPKSIKRSIARSLRKQRAEPRYEFTAEDLSDISMLREDYTALSYVWGSKIRSQVVLCDGKPVLITPNCESALRRLRQTSATVPLWVDAICINQDDTSEREKQVTLMGEVYKLAQKTVIWLGENDNKAIRRLFSRMKYWGSIIPALISVEFIRYCPDFVRRRLFRNFTQGMTVSEITGLIANEWSERIWTVQEYIFSNKGDPIVMHGESSIPASKFAAWTLPLARLTVHMPSFNASDRAVLELGLFRFHTRTNGVESFSTQAFNPENLPPDLIWAAIMTALLNKCSLPHDKIYAIYGLFLPYLAHLPPVDYSISEFKLYQAFTHSTILLTRTFWPGIGLISDMTHPHLPSWVLNLSRTSDDLFPLSTTDEGLRELRSRTGRLGILNREFRQFKPEDNALEYVPVSVPDAFALRGTSIGRISRTAVLVHKQTALNPDCLLNWIQFVLSPGIGSRNTSHGWARKRWNALKDLLYRGDDETERKRIGKLLLDVERWLANHDWFEPEGCDSNEFTSARREFQFTKLLTKEVLFRTAFFVRFVTVHRMGSNLFFTDRGELGLGEGHIMEGDTAVLLTGCPNPVILRSQGPHWRMVGRAHMHGVEAGEEWRRRVPVEEMETFIIV